MDEKIAFIVLNYNRTDLTIRLIENIIKIENLPKENVCIFVVDNGSENEKRNLLINYFMKNSWLVMQEDSELSSSDILENIRSDALGILILSSKNRGYAGGNNIALRVAYNMGFKYAIIMNNDVLLVEPISSKLISTFKCNQNIAVIGPKVLQNDDDPPIIEKRPAIFIDFFLVRILYPFSRILQRFYQKHRKKILEKESSSPVEVYAVHGCCVGVKLEALNEVGWYDENTFLYMEEYILAEKMISHGYKTVYLPDVCILHIHESRNDNPQLKKYLYESEIYYLKNYRKLSGILLIFIKAVAYYRLFIIGTITKKLLLVIKKIRFRKDRKS